MRAIALGALFLPFAFYAWRDHQMHSGGRPVPKPEALLHLGLGVALAGIVTTALMGLVDRMLVFVAMLVAVRSTDMFSIAVRTCGRTARGVIAEQLVEPIRRMLGR